MNLRSRLNVLKSLTPWSLILILLVAVVIFSPAVSEYISVKRDFLRLWHDQAALLSETIIRTADKIALFDEEARQREQERLETMAVYVRHLDSLNAKDRKRVFSYVHSQGKVMLLYLDEDGNIANTHHRTIKNRQRFLQTAIKELLDFGWERLRKDGVLLSPIEKPGPLIAITRRAQEPGFIALISRPFVENMPHIRQRLMAWLDHLSNQPGILYLALWQGDKRIAVSGIKAEEPLTPPSPGPPRGMMLRLQDRNVYEFQRREPNGLGVQIGFSVAALENLQNHLIQRLVINSVLLLLLGGVLSVYILKRQNYALLSRQYEQLQTSTSAILENMEEGIMVLDGQTTIAVFNKAAARLLNLKTNELTGKNFTEVDWPLPAELQLKILSSEIVKNYTLQNETGRYLLFNSQRIWYNEDASELEEAPLYLVLIQDYTTQKELSDYRVRRSKLQAMGALASRVAHEIRNPLNSIGVLAQRLEREFIPAREQEEFKQMTGAIRQESARINRIIETFLEYARQPQMQTRPIELKSIIEEAAPVLNALGDVRLSYELQNGCRVQADADQLRQALLNIVRNAVEATPAGGDVKISAICRDGWARIAVTDQGPGIPDDIKDKIFDLYFTTKEKGNGLGLSIVEKIISAHGGKVWCENVKGASGGITGACFIVELPLEGREIRSNK